jgi:hypothetical protein
VRSFIFVNRVKLESDEDISSYTRERLCVIYEGDEDKQGH